MRRLKRIYHTETNGRTERLDAWRPGTSLIFDGRRFLATHAYWATRPTFKPKKIIVRDVVEILPDGSRQHICELGGWRKGWQSRALMAAGYTEEQIFAHQITERLKRGN